MAILTWQNVAAPDLTVGQAGFRTAGELFNQAAQNGQTIVNTIRAEEAKQKAIQQAEAEKILTQQYLTAGNSKAITDMLARGLGKNADGSYMTGITSENVTPELMQKFAAQGKYLDTQAQEQAKRNVEEAQRSASYKGAQILEKYAPIAGSDLSRALSGAMVELQKENIPVEEAKSIVTTLKSLEKDRNVGRQLRLAEAALNKQAQEEARNRAGMDLADKLRNLKDPGSFLRMYQSESDPLVRRAAADALSKTDPEIVKTYLSPLTDFGYGAASTGNGKSSGKGAKSKSPEITFDTNIPVTDRLGSQDSVQVYDFKDNFKSLADNKDATIASTPTARMYLQALRESEGNKDELAVAVRKAVAELNVAKGGSIDMKEVDWNEVMDYTQRILNKANANGLAINPTAAAKVFVRSLESASGGGISDGIPGLDIPGVSENAQLETIGTDLGQFAANSYTTAKANDAKFKKAKEMIVDFMKLEQKVASERKVAAANPTLAPDLPSDEAALHTLAQEIAKLR